MEASARTSLLVVHYGLCGECDSVHWRHELQREGRDIVEVVTLQACFLAVAVSAADGETALCHRGAFLVPQKA